MMMKIPFYSITNGNQERIACTTKALMNYGITTEFFHFEKHKTNGKVGCFLSHISMYKYALAHDMEYICITEDNLTTSSRMSTSIKKHIHRFITTHPTWNIIVLGGWYIPFSTVEHTTYPSIYKTSSIHGTSCYIIHKRFYTTILKQYKSHINEHIDAYIMREAQPQAYIIYPLLFRRNNIIPTSNTYFSNDIVNGYYYITCSKDAHRTMEYFATNHITIWLVSCGIVLLCILLWFLHRPTSK